MPTSIYLSIYWKYIHIYHPYIRGTHVADCFWWLKGTISNRLNHTFPSCVLLILPLDLPSLCFNPSPPPHTFCLPSGSDSFSNGITQASEFTLFLSLETCTATTPNLIQIALPHCYLKQFTHVVENCDTCEFCEFFFLSFRRHGSCSCLL